MTWKFDIRIGDEVWLMYNDRAVSATVSKAMYTKFISSVDYKTIIESEVYYLTIAGRELRETYTKDSLFPTKEDLIKSL